MAQPTGPYLAAKEYVDLMIEGAREHRLDPAWVEELVALRRSLG